MLNAFSIIYYYIISSFIEFHINIICNTNKYTILSYNSKVLLLLPVIYYILYYIYKYIIQIPMITNKGKLI